MRFTDILFVDTGILWFICYFQHVKSESELEMEAHGATVEIGFPLKSECQKRGDLSFYAYYTLWRNDRMPMYVVSCTSPKPDGKEHVEAAFSYFQKNKYPPTVRYDEASLVSPIF